MPYCDKIKVHMEEKIYYIYIYILPDLLIKRVKTYRSSEWLVRLYGIPYNIPLCLLNDCTY